MGLSASCGNCHRTVQVENQFAGKTVRCPRCGSPINVPTTSQADEPTLDRPSQARATPAPASRRSSHEMAQRSSSKSDAAQRVARKRDGGRPDSAKYDSAKYDNRKSGSGQYDKGSREVDELEEDYVPMLQRRRGPNPFVTAFAAAWESLGEWRREYVVGAVVVLIIVALQLIYGGWFESAKPSKPPVVAEETPDKDEPAPKKEPVPVVIVDEKQKEEANKDAYKEPDKEAGAKATLKRVKPGEGTATAVTGNNGAGNPQAAGRQRRGSRPSLSAFGGPQSDEQRTVPPPFHSTSTQQGNAQEKVPTVKTDHTGPFTAVAPPEVGEVVVVRLKDGLHIAKVTSVDVSELRCDITVLEAAAYHKNGQIRETSRTDNVRFGQMHTPTFLKPKGPMPE